MTLSRLAVKNIAGSLFRSGAVFLCAALVAGLGLAATLVVLGAENSLQANLSRMGADLLVFPWGIVNQKAESAHLMSTATQLWMPQADLDRIAQVEGVAAVTPQLYLATLRDSPLSTRPELFLMAYDPATDFVVEPWLEQKLNGGLGLGEAVAGAYILAVDGGQTVSVYGYDLKLAGQLEPTGSDLDQSLFVTFDTAQEILRHTQRSGLSPFKIASGSISTALVKVAMGSDTHDVSVRVMEQVPGVVPIESAGLFQTQRTQMIGLLRTVLIMLSLTWLLSMLFMGLAFSLAVNERRRQIGVLRALGASQTAVLKSLLAESAILALAGGLTGNLLAILLITPLQDQITRLAGVPLLLPAPLAFSGLILGGLFLALASVTLAAYLPAIRISRQEPALVMKE
ncbi:MAG: FtsX-like permease family protein [Anaerolineae bacterium]|nr:FtsX-like permease family protein [Anaerolineae bacterium]